MGAHDHRESKSRNRCPKSVSDLNGTRIFASSSSGGENPVSVQFFWEGKPGVSSVFRFIRRKRSGGCKIVNMLILFGGA